MKNFWNSSNSYLVKLLWTTVKNVRTQLKNKDEAFRKKKKKEKKKLMTENLWLFSQKNSILDIWLSSEYASGFITFYHKNLFALEVYLIKDWKTKTCQYKYYFSGNFT